MSGKLILNVFTIAVGLGSILIAAACTDRSKPAPGLLGPVSTRLSARPSPGTEKSGQLVADGAIDDIDSEPARLRIGAMWFRVDDETEYDIAGCTESCGFDDLNVGDLARVKYLATSASALGYLAIEVEVEQADPQDDDELETEGTVDTIDHDTLRLSVAGQWFYADNQTEIDFDDCEGTFADIDVGNEVKIEHDAICSGLGMRAHQIEVRATDCGDD